MRQGVKSIEGKKESVTALSVEQDKNAPRTRCSCSSIVNRDLVYRRIRGFDAGTVAAAKHAAARTKAKKLFSLAESLGGVESLIGHPATMTHASIPAELRQARGIDDGLVRLSVGIEDADDLQEDLRLALA